MRLRSGEVLHRGAERFGGQQAYVNLHAAAQPKADLVVATGDHFHQRRILGDVGDSLLTPFFGAAGFSSDQDVEIAHAVASATQRSGRRDLVDARELAEILGQFASLLFGRVNQVAAPDAAVVLNGLQQFGFVLFAHAGQLANLSLAREFLDAVDVADFVGAPDECDGLRSEALNLQQLQHRRVVFLEQFHLDGELAAFEKLLEVVQHSLADAGNSQNLLGIGDQILDLLRVIFNRLRRVAVGANAERVLPIDFEQIRRFIKNVGDGLVVHRLKIIKMGVFEPALSASVNARRKPIQTRSLIGRRRITEETESGYLRSLGYVGRLRPLLTFGDFELHLVAFLQALVPLGGNCAVVNKDIGAIRAPDEPVPLGVIEPLDGPFQSFHKPPLFRHVPNGGPRGVHRSR